MVSVGRLYFDWLNQAPLLESVQQALHEVIAELGNPSSLHAEGRRAMRWLERARAQVAGLLKRPAEEVHFTSSGTEANGWALEGIAEAYRHKGDHIVVSAVEHLSILETARRMEKRGWRVTVVPVDRFGRIDVERLTAALTPSTVLVSLQWANGEVGTIQPMAQLVECVKSKGILFHSDAIAYSAQMALDLDAIKVDALSLAGNVWGGPLGVGALWVRKGVRILPLFVGGTQEGGRRAGSENLIGIVGMGAAAEAMGRIYPSFSTVSSLRERLWCGIMEHSPEARLNGHPSERLPGHLSVSFPNEDGERLVLALDLKGVAVGLGSACSVRIRKASHVLRAMGVDEALALGTVVFSFGVGTTEEEVQQLLERLSQVRGKTKPCNAM
jgi:cysteine desulfurase